MELKEFVLTALNGSQRSIKRATDGLTKPELAWRPGPECNSIGIILFHVIRSEDNFIQATIQQKPTLWESAKWFEKLGLPASDSGAGYTVEQIGKFNTPELADMIAYFDAVRAKTLEYVNGLTPADYDKKINWGRMGEFTIGALISLVANHAAQHIGEVSYIRGQQRGCNK